MILIAGLGNPRRVEMRGARERGLRFGAEDDRLANAGRTGLDFNGTAPKPRPPGPLETAVPGRGS